MERGLDRDRRQVPISAAPAAAATAVAGDPKRRGVV